MRIGYASVSHRAAATYTPPPPAGTWTPAQMTSIKAWFDPQQGVTLASGKVSSWVDAINGSVASQATTSLQPAFSTTTMNGLKGILTDRTAEWALLVDSTLVVGTPCSFIAIFNATVNSTGAQTLLAAASAGGVSFRINGSAIYDIVAEASAVIGSSTVTVQNAYKICSATVNSTTYAIRVNGSASGSGSNAHGATTNVLAYLLHNPSSGGEMWSGSLGDMIYTSVVSSSTDIEKAEGYLAWKYSLASLLPSGHPYKSAAP